MFGLITWFQKLSLIWAKLWSSALIRCRPRRPGGSAWGAKCARIKPCSRGYRRARRIDLEADTDANACARCGTWPPRFSNVTDQSPQGRAAIGLNRRQNFGPRVLKDAGSDAET